MDATTRAIQGRKDRRMSDTISRQAAIDRAVSIPMFGRDVKMVAVSEIKNLPSAQPEQQIPQMRGWVCPVCGRGLSPYTSVCPCNNGKGWEITC